MSALLHEPRPSPLGCLHESVVWLGAEGTATFYECDACGGVMIVQGDRQWLLRRAVPPQPVLADGR